MKAFQFRLERLLDWERRRFETERQRTRECFTALSAVREKAARLKSAHLAVERSMAAASVLTGADLKWLGSYRSKIASQERQLQTEEQKRQIDATAQQAKLTEHQRQVKLLENFRARRLGEHHRAVDREIDALASESYLSRWFGRRGAAPADWLENPGLAPK